VQAEPAAPPPPPPTLPGPPPPALRTLKLTLSRLPFEATKSQEKRIEGRKDGAWIRSRLLHSDGRKKDYDCVKYYHGPALSEGYPTCEMKFDGARQAMKPFTIGPYSNGLTATFPAGSWMIFQSPMPADESKVCSLSVYFLISFSFCLFFVLSVYFFLF
jgi:hypothetical protein